MARFKSLHRRSDRFHTYSAFVRVEMFVICNSVGYRVTFIIETLIGGSLCCNATMIDSVLIVQKFGIRGVIWFHCAKVRY